MNEPKFFLLHNGEQVKIEADDLVSAQLQAELYASRESGRVILYSVTQCAVYNQTEN